MFKVLAFLESEIYNIESELNALKGYEYVASWTTNTKLVIIMKKKAEAGRPKKETTEE